MLNLIWEYRFVILVVVAVALYAGLEWTSFKSQSYSLMLQAKRLAKDEVLKNGDEQVEWIIKRAYQFLPKRITVFVSEDLMRKVIKYLYDKLRDYLDERKLNSGLE